MVRVIHFWVNLATDIETNKCQPKRTDLCTLGIYWNEYGILYMILCCSWLLGISKLRPHFSPCVVVDRIYILKQINVVMLSNLFYWKHWRACTVQRQNQLWSDTPSRCRIVSIASRKKCMVYCHWMVKKVTILYFTHPPLIIMVISWSNTYKWRFYYSIVMELMSG